MFFNTREISFEESVLLHIVSGDFAIEGDFLFWMYFMMVPCLKDCSFEELSNIRTKFIAKCDWDSPENAKYSFRKRDIVIHNCHKPTKWYFGAALNCSISLICCSVRLFFLEAVNLSALEYYFY